MADTGKTRIILPAAQLAALDAIGIRAGMRRTELIRTILAKWLEKPTLPTAAKPSLLQLDARHRALIARRVEVVEGWRECRKRAVAHHRSIYEATANYLDTLPKAHRPCRGTLYGWDRRYFAAGAIGLMDKRRIRGQTATEDAHRRRAIKAPSTDKRRLKTAAV